MTMILGRFACAFASSFCGAMAVYDFFTGRIEWGCFMLFLSLFNFGTLIATLKDD